MDKFPIMSVSGIRGKTDETLTPFFISKTAYFHTIKCGRGNMIVGRDTRPSGKSLAAAAFRGILLAGGYPVDIGIAPTPTACFAAKEFNADGGIILTASHNPLPYNGYKMVHSSGRLFNEHECNEVYEMIRNSEPPLPEDFEAVDIGNIRTVDAATPHINRICSSVDTDLIRNQRIKVAADPVNGAASVVLSAFFKALGVEWAGINDEPTGIFAHNPEPRPDNLKELSAMMSSSNEFWCGFAFDPDADRLALMGGKGEPLSEEMTLALSLQNVLSKTPSTVVTNLSTSMVIDDVAETYGCEVIRSKIGEANVVEKMLEHKSLIGGEGNGGVIYPKISTVRDSLTAAALILELMAKTNSKINKLADNWPCYHIVKKKFPLESISSEKLILKAKSLFLNDKTDTLDGLKIIRDNEWIHIRPSNTEPVVRCIAEAASAERAEYLADYAINKINEAVK